MGFLQTLENKATKKWEVGGVQFYIVPMFLMGIGAYHCGYAAFPNKQLLDDAGNTVDVHGGITLDEQDGATAIYGFDCAHAYDENNELIKTESWLTEECERMGKQLLELYDAANIAPPSNLSDIPF